VTWEKFKKKSHARVCQESERAAQKKTIENEIKNAREKKCSASAIKD
jgi:hypothetical protein